VDDAIYEVRDPIYGFVKLTKKEWEIVNCPAYQRLRDIRQLAMGHMVYPGANHTRFEHSIGCVHLSSVILDHLREKDSDVLTSEHGIDRDNFARAKQILRLASLLHDVGHPPFSHSGEDLLPVEKPAGKRGTPRRVDHEEMSARLIQQSEIGQLITDRFAADAISPDDVVAVATKPSVLGSGRFRSHHIFLNAILTGDLGSDRIDYLLRDAYHSGQKSGDFDYRRLVSAMALVEKPKDEGEGTAVGVDESGWLVAEQMIVSRYLMYVALYFHKTKRIYEKHLEAFMREWLAPKGGHLPSGLAEYVRMTDSTVLAAIQESAGNPGANGHSHALRFRNRGHMRLAKELILADNYLPKETPTGVRRAPNRERFEQLRLHVSKKFGNVVLADAPDHSATKMFDKSRILVSLEGQTRYLDDISEIVRGMSSNIWRGRIYADAKELGNVRQSCEKWLELHQGCEKGAGAR
jgi:HD superfamily phosphohydrolase